MSEIILSVTKLPQTVLRFFPEGNVKLREENGVVTLSPLSQVSDCDGLLGLFADTELSVDAFLQQKWIDKELEL